MVRQVMGRKKFPCRFYEVPVMEYIADSLPEDIFDLNDESVDVHSGTLYVDFTDVLGKGKFKTTHPGRVVLDAGKELTPFTNQKVCVKQIYREREGNGGIARVEGRYELSAFVTECNCVQWASILLDLTYQFIAREVDRRGQPELPIPQLRYTKVMVAIVEGGDFKEKAFLVDKWIETDEAERLFVKYINNRFPNSCVSSYASTNARIITNFLIFSQHVQWQMTKMGAFVSDYQGQGKLLTDPQITCNPCVIHACLPAVLLISLTTTAFTAILPSVQGISDQPSLNFANTTSATNIVVFLN